MKDLISLKFTEISELLPIITSRKLGTTKLVETLHWRELFFWKEVFHIVHLINKTSDNPLNEGRFSRSSTGPLLLLGILA